MPTITKNFTPEFSDLNLEFQMLVALRVTMFEQIH